MNSCTKRETLSIDKFSDRSFPSSFTVTLRKSGRLCDGPRHFVTATEGHCPPSISPERTNPRGKSRSAFGEFYRRNVPTLLHLLVTCNPLVWSGLKPLPRHHQRREHQPRVPFDQTGSTRMMFNTEHDGLVFTILKLSDSVVSRPLLL